MSSNSRSSELRRESVCVELMTHAPATLCDVLVASMVNDAASISEPNVPAVGRAPEESAVDQRPHHDNTRLPIDAQQPLGLWHRDAEPWHFRVLGPSAAGQISKGGEVSFGSRDRARARHHDGTSRFCVALVAATSIPYRTLLTDAPTRIG